MHALRICTQETRYVETVTLVVADNSMSVQTQEVAVRRSGTRIESLSIDAATKRMKAYEVRTRTRARHEVADIDEDTRLHTSKHARVDAQTR